MNIHKLLNSVLEPDKILGEWPKDEDNIFVPQSLLQNKNFSLEESVLLCQFISANNKWLTINTLQEWNHPDEPILSMLNSLKKRSVIKTKKENNIIYYKINSEKFLELL